MISYNSINWLCSKNNTHIVILILTIYFIIPIKRYLCYKIIISRALEKIILQLITCPTMESTNQRDFKTIVLNLTLMHQVKIYFFFYLLSFFKIYLSFFLHFFQSGVCFFLIKNMRFHMDIDQNDIDSLFMEKINQTESSPTSKIAANGGVSANQSNIRND